MHQRTTIKITILIEWVKRGGSVTLLRRRLLIGCCAVRNGKFYCRLVWTYVQMSNGHFLPMLKTTGSVKDKKCITQSIPQDRNNVISNCIIQKSLQPQIKGWRDSTYKTIYIIAQIYVPTNAMPKRLNRETKMIIDLRT